MAVVLGVYYPSIAERYACSEANGRLLCLSLAHCVASFLVKSFQKDFEKVLHRKKFADILSLFCEVSATQPYAFDALSPDLVHPAAFLLPASAGILPQELQRGELMFPCHICVMKIIPYPMQ